MQAGEWKRGKNLPCQLLQVELSCQSKPARKYFSSNVCIGIGLFKGKLLTSKKCQTKTMPRMYSISWIWMATWRLVSDSMSRQIGLTPSPDTSRCPFEHQDISMWPSSETFVTLFSDFWSWQMLRRRWGVVLWCGGLPRSDRQHLGLIMSGPR